MFRRIVTVRDMKRNNTLTDCVRVKDEVMTALYSKPLCIGEEKYIITKNVQNAKTSLTLCNMSYDIQFRVNIR